MASPEPCWATLDLSSDDWQPGTVVARGAAGVEVLFDSSGSRATLPPAQVLPQNGPEQDHTPDLAQLVHLSEPCLLHTLGCRYSEGAIYSYTGTILIALNPWRELSLYSEEQLARYRDQPLGSMPPHLFAIADLAFRGMRQARRCPRRCCSPLYGQRAPPPLSPARRCAVSAAGGRGPDYPGLGRVGRRQDRVDAPRARVPRQDQQPARAIRRTRSGGGPQPVENPGHG